MLTVIYGCVIRALRKPWGRRATLISIDFHEKRNFCDLLHEFLLHYKRSYHGLKSQRISSGRKRAVGRTDLDRHGNALEMERAGSPPPPKGANNSSGGASEEVGKVWETH